MSASGLNDLLDMYGRMLLIREFEDRATDLTRGDDPAISGSIHTCGGQEAIPVGAMSALRDDDRVVATYRGHGWALETGVTPAEMLAEMAHRQGGVNGGRAGSLLALAPDRGFIGQNSIVGAGGPIACGAAIAARVAKSDRVVIVSFGDGATSQGGLHESLVTAAALNLPVIFLCENNGWAEMTPTAFSLKPGMLAKRAEGYGMAGAEVDGCDPEAVRAAVAEAAARARAGQGPTLIEANVVRLGGHYNRDIQHYRPRADRQAAEARDPFIRMRERLLALGATEGTLAARASQAAETIAAAVEETLASPRPAAETTRSHVYALVPEAVAGEPAAHETVNISYGQAARQALFDEMGRQPEVILFGEDLAKAGGVFGVTRGLQSEFGPERVFDTPIAETAILGSAVGAAMQGLKPVAEIMFADFLFVALDQLINQAAKLRYVSNNRTGVPLVVRTQQGVTPGSCAQHAQCVEAFLAHVPGLKVGLPGTPQDAYAMLRAAIADPDPCVVIESRCAYQDMGDVTLGGAPEAAAGARLLRDGADIVLISWGSSVRTCIAAADLLAEQGVAASVLDLRWLSPLDHEAIREAVERCGAVVIVHEANLTGGFGAEVMAGIVERHGAALRGIRRIASCDIPMPAAPDLQRLVIPSAQNIVDAAADLLGVTALERQAAATG